MNKKDELPEISKSNLVLFLAKNSFDTVKLIAKCVATVLCFQYVYLMLDVLAGKETNANLALELISELRIGNWLPWVLFVLAVIWALGERYMRKRKTEYMQGRIRELEEKKDPKRTSSGLLANGDTNPKDIL